MFSEALCCEALSILGSAQREERKTVDMAPDFYRQFHCMVLANRSAVLRILGVDEVEMQSGTVLELVVFGKGVHGNSLYFS